MILDLRNLTEFPARLDKQIDSVGLRLNQDDLTVSGVSQVRLEIIRSERIYYCQGKIECEATLVCSRCLESYPVTLNGEIDFSIQEADEQSISVDEIPENEILVAPGTSEVDITQPLREALLLEIPLKPLCSEDCLGLCPICGVNRNQQACNCRVEHIDSRWNGLRSLLNDNVDSERRE